jgi:uncharacterized protein YecE (DUF72 family)
VYHESLQIANCRLPIFLIHHGCCIVLRNRQSAIGNLQLAMIYVGTSGYSYKEWKGSFYPEKIPASEMLSYYATRLSAVELNNTFYRRPQPSTIEGWKNQVPENFRFTMKASQGITHFRRLKDAGEATRFMLNAFAPLGERLGAVLFRLREDMEKNLQLLETFLKELPEGTRAAFDFRHPSWFDKEVFALLRSARQVLCVSDRDEWPVNQIEKTADWGYVRLRRVKYSKAELAEWVKRIRAQRWKDTYVFFKHEDEGTGPRLAAQFIALAAD